MGSSTKTGDEMADDGTKITIRISSEEIQKMEDFMADRNIGNRSDFIREAICAYIDSKQRSVDEMASKGGIFIHLTDVQMRILNEIAIDKTLADSAEEYARSCVLEKILPKSTHEEVILRITESILTDDKQQ